MARGSSMLSSSVSSSSLSLLLRHSLPRLPPHSIQSLALLPQRSNTNTASLLPPPLQGSPFVHWPPPRRGSKWRVISRKRWREANTALAGDGGSVATAPRSPARVAARDLSDLATEHSICPSKSDGGMLGWVRKGQMVPEFEEAAFTAPLNKVVRVKTKFGWHLVQALSEREAAFLQDIQPEELHTRLQDPSFLDEAQLIDVREPNEISIAAIEGFEAYPLSQFSQWGPQISSKLDLSKDTYLLCHHGVRSLQAAQWLQTQGFRRLYNVAGGIHQYSIKANRTVPTY